MKFSKKMILIPASGREEPENEKMSELDQEMSAILKNPKLSTKEKVELYNEVLRRNLIFENRLLQKPHGIEKNKNSEPMQPIIEDSFTSTPDSKIESPVLNVKTEYKNNINTSASSKNASSSSRSSSDRKLYDEDQQQKAEEEEEEDENEEEGEVDDEIIKWETYSTPKRPPRKNTNVINYFESDSSLQRSLDKRRRRKNKQSSIKNKKEYYSN